MSPFFSILFLLLAVLITIQFFVNADHYFHYMLNHHYLYHPNTRHNLAPPLHHRFQFALTFPVILNFKYFVLDQQHHHPSCLNTLDYPQPHFNIPLLLVIFFNYCQDFVPSMITYFSYLL